MDASGAGRLNRSSPSCLNRSAQRIDFFHGLLGLHLHPPDSVWEARLSLPQRPGGASRPFYHYWTRKARGKTVGLKLTEDELGLYREWIENNRELERLVKEMRRSSSRVLALITGRQAP